MQRYPYMVDETPYCIWDKDLSQFDLDFLNMLDPEYFNHVARINGDLLNGEEDKYAALTLRTAYSHALETLFALICAAVQAPQSIAAWLLTYRNSELTAVVTKIHAGEQIFSRHNMPPTWEGIAEMFTPPMDDDRDKTRRLRSHVAKLWRTFANDFLAQEMKDEYNNFKHGLRVNMHGSILMMGFETTPGVVAPPDKMEVLGNSKFGNAYFTTEKLQDTNRTNIRYIHHSHNWNPQKFVIALQFISMSIHNVVKTLKVWKDAQDSAVEYRFPADENSFALLWSLEQPSITRVRMKIGFDEEELHLWTKDEVRASYS